MSVFIYNTLVEGDFAFGDEVYVIDSYQEYDLESEADDNRYYRDLPWHEAGYEPSPTYPLRGRFFLTFSGTEGGLSNIKDGSIIDYEIKDPSLFRMYPIVESISGLWMLEGREVVILADGNVITGQTVSNGSVSIPGGAGIIHIGLRYVCDFEPLNINAGENMQGRKLQIPEVTVRFEMSGGGLFGRDFEDELVPLFEREYEVMGAPTELVTGDRNVTIPSDWKSTGRFFIRQRDPLPMSILAIVPEIEGEDI